MLFLLVSTTLIPTILHLVIGLAGFWMAGSPSWRRATDRLRTPDTTDWQNDTPPVAWANDTTRLIRRGIYWGWFKGIVSVALIATLLYAAILAVWPHITQLLS